MLFYVKEWRMSNTRQNTCIAWKYDNEMKKGCRVAYVLKWRCQYNIRVKFDEHWMQIADSFTLLAAKHRFFALIGFDLAKCVRFVWYLVKICHIWVQVCKSMRQNTLIWMTIQYLIQHFLCRWNSVFGDSIHRMQHFHWTNSFEEKNTSDERYLKRRSQAFALLMQIAFSETGNSLTHFRIRSNEDMTIETFISFPIMAKQCANPKHIRKG